MRAVAVTSASNFVAIRMNLVIVESPTKAKTIQKYLGKDYTVESSFGHIRDLPKTKLGIDTDDNFKPHYLVPAKAKKTVTKLKSLAKKADTVVLATDADREGEAISWHLKEALDLKDDETKRIVFHEITKHAIEEALAHPRELDDNLIDAQQARRTLDRLVGYKLSPFLWKKVARGLSAGRVQSVALRLIVEREEEIRAFKPQEYWSIAALLAIAETDDSLTAHLHERAGKKLDKFAVANEADAAAITAHLRQASYAISDIEEKDTTKNPLPPFTTSTLQQAAHSRLGFSAKQTMALAQKLYEHGHITYMRTDSVNLSDQFMHNAQAYITEQHGKEYAVAKPRHYKAKAKNTQEAHEAIRPTDVHVASDALEKAFGPRERKLYQLIWQRAVATQAASAKLKNTAISITATHPEETYGLRATGQVIVFDGFLKIYPTATKESLLPAVNTKSALSLEDVVSEQHFTEPPARYSDATLVKALEKYGIGRPSTYAPTIATITARNYVERNDQKRFVPTDVGELVNGVLVEHFPHIVDYQFTAQLEDDLDDVARGEKAWQAVIGDFYTPFEKNLAEKTEEVSREEVTSMHELGTDPKTGKPVFARIGRFGPCVQLGSKDDEEKPQFASLAAGQSVQTITLEEALKLLSLPRVAGHTADGKDIIANIGRYGPYLQIDRTFYSLKEDDPYTITEERAQAVIAQQEQEKANKIIQEFEGGIQVLHGRYGPYITDGEKNAKLPKDVEPKTITLAQAQEALKNGKPKKGRRRTKR